MSLVQGVYSIGPARDEGSISQSGVASKISNVGAGSLDVHLADLEKGLLLALSWHRLLHMAHI